MINEKTVINELDMIFERWENGKIIKLQSTLISEWLKVLKPIVKEMEDFLELHKE